MLLYLCRRFLAIGALSFGGHMALISMIRTKLVSTDKCLDDTKLMEGIALASILPGPMAVNVVAYIGYYLSGWLGSVLSVISVLFPSFVIVIGLSILYFKFQSVYDLSLLIRGIIPVVIAIIISTAISLGRKNCKQPYQWIVTLTSAGMLGFFSGYLVTLIVLLIAASLGIFLQYKQMNNIPSKNYNKNSLKIWGVLISMIAIFGLQFIRLDSIALKLFVVFSNVSLTLFGGGYVMVPILKSLIVDQYQWLTSNEFSLGISIGQVTPGPILISAAFFGYKIQGIAGALICTIAIFLPSSILMVVASQVMFKFGENPYVKAALNGILPAVVGMIFFAGYSLLKDHLTNYPILISILVLIVSFILIYKFQRSPLLVIVIGIMLSYLYSLF